MGQAIQREREGGLQVCERAEREREQSGEREGGGGGDRERERETNESERERERESGREGEKYCSAEGGDEWQLPDGTS